MCAGARASVYALSGGMAQRPMVARAIFHRPAVLLLDEATAGLDPQRRLALWEILERLNDEGQTILLTTHYTEEADKLCDRVAIVDHGRILALDTPDALKRGIGADTVVAVRSTGDLAAFGDLLSREVPGVTRTRIAEGMLQLHLAGGVVVRSVWSRALPSAPSSVRVYQDSVGDWWARFVVKVHDESLPATGRAIGIAWGVRAIATTKRGLSSMAAKHCRELSLVPPPYTTMDRSSCGARTKHRLGLSQRIFACTSCGDVMHRDKNAAAVMVARAGFVPAGAESVRPEPQLAARAV